MKRNRFIGIAALMPLVLSNFAVLPVHAEVTDSQTVDTSAEETSAECQVIYKSTYDFSEEIPKYPELDVTAYGYEGIYDGKSHGITVDCKTEGATILYSTDGKTYSTKKPEYTEAGTYVTYYRVEKDGYTTTTGSAVVKIKGAATNNGNQNSGNQNNSNKNSNKNNVNQNSSQSSGSTEGMNNPSNMTLTTIRDSQIPLTETVKVSNVQTGDESNIFFYAVMLAASAFGLTGLKRRGEKRK